MPPDTFLGELAQLCDSGLNHQLRFLQHVSNLGILVAAPGGIGHLTKLPGNSLKTVGKISSDQRRHTFSFRASQHIARGPHRTNLSEKRTPPASRSRTEGVEVLWNACELVGRLPVSYWLN